MISLTPAAVMGYPVGGRDLRYSWAPVPKKFLCTSWSTVWSRTLLASNACGQMLLPGA